MILGKKEIIEAVAIAGLSALATKLVDILGDEVKRRREKDDDKKDDKKKEPVK